MAAPPRSEARQLLLDLATTVPVARAETTAPAAGGPDPLPDLVRLGRLRLAGLGLGALAFEARWNPRMRSCAGRAFSRPPARIELNPLLRNLDDGEIERTFWHELAHLVAHARAGRRRIRPHGAEWRRACADLGIPDELPTHRLPLPRRRARWRHHYACPGCGTVLPRVRPLRARVACLACCRTHNRGRFDPRFQFRRLPGPPPEPGPPATGSAP